VVYRISKIPHFLNIFSLIIHLFFEGKDVFVSFIQDRTRRLGTHTKVIFNTVTLVCCRSVGVIFGLVNFCPKISKTGTDSSEGTVVNEIPLNLKNTPFLLLYCSL